MQIRAARSQVLPLFVLAFAFARSAEASERRFGFTYESAVLAPGEVELEPWTTARLGRDHYYGALDERLEFELGLVPNLQTSLYWNFTTSTASVLDASTGTRSRVSDTRMKSISSEWKYRISDALADPLGSAVYFEGSYGPDEVELEARIILDKQSGNALVAANLVGEQEWELRSGGNESEQLLNLTLGAGYFFTPSLVGGLEGISTTLLEDGELESSAIYAGPALAWAAEHYWLVLTGAPQIAAPKPSSGRHLDLANNERLWARVLLGFRL